MWTAVTEKDAAAWIAALCDLATHLHIDNAVHDVQPPEWRLDGLRLTGHLNWMVLANGVRGMIAGREVILEPGGWLCLAPGTPLYFRPLHAGQRVRLLRFRLHLTRAGRSLSIPGGGFQYPHAHDLQSLTSLLIAEQARAEAIDLLRRRSLLTVLYTSAFDYLRRPTSTQDGHLSAVDCAQIEAKVASSSGQAIAPGDLAALFRMDATAFHRAFRHRYGTNPRTWLADRRIRTVAELLLTTRATAASIAEAAGFADSFHFSRRFKAVMGCGVRTWRRRHGIIE